ncbi:MAG TPA: matrixin family metalloprotease, partial [Terriglobia bacterium]|nr:matrixin family metalloprotease [Terriglobia bacterium]
NPLARVTLSRWERDLPQNLVRCVLIVAVSASMQLSSPVTYFVEDGRTVPGFDSGDRELAEMALAAWSRESGGHLKFVPTTQESAALVRVRWISASDGLYGETQRSIVNGKPGAIVNVSPSVAGLGEPISTMASKDRLLRDTIVYLTCVHETGHALGLQHTRNFEDIMYAFGYGGDIVEYFSRYRRNIKSRADIARFSGVSPGDVKVLKSLY